LYDRYFYKGQTLRPAAENLQVRPVERPAERPAAALENRRAGASRSGFSNTLADQLRAKNFDLLGTERQDSKDE